MKKSIAFLLALAMAVSLITPAFADTGEPGGVGLNVRAEESSHFELPIEYIFSLVNAKRVMNATVLFEVDGTMLDGGDLTFLTADFSAMDREGGPIAWTRKEGDTWQGELLVMYLGDPDGFTAAIETDIFRLSYRAKQLGGATLRVTDIRIVALDDTDSAVYVTGEIGDAATTVIALPAQLYSTYDLNKDGVIDERDLAMAQRYYLAAAGDANWAAALACDFNDDGIVNMLDLIDLFRNFGVAVTPDVPPGAIAMGKLSAMELAPEGSGSIAVSATASNGQAVQLTAQSDDTDVATVSVNGGTLTVHAVGHGTATIAVTASAPNCLDVVRRFAVTVTGLTDLAYGARSNIIVINAADALLNESYAFHTNAQGAAVNPKTLFCWTAVEGGTAVQLLSEAGENLGVGTEWAAGDLDNAPGLHYVVDVQEAGTYYLSFFSHSPDADSDSFHVGVNGAYTFTTNTANVISNGSDNYGASVGERWFVCNRQTLTLNAGRNTITLWGSNTGVLLRQLMLTRQNPIAAKCAWKNPTGLISGYIRLSPPEDIALAYGAAQQVPIAATATNGAAVALRVESSHSDIAAASAVTGGAFTVTAGKAGLATITVTATATNCMELVIVFNVSVAHALTGTADAGAPLELMVAPGSETQDSITLVWDKPEVYADVTGYGVYRDGVKVGTTGPKVTHDTVYGLAAGTDYTFRVEAVYGGGAVASTQTLHAATAPAGVVIDITAAPYHAVGDGVEKDTAAIQAAIDACPVGGTVLIPAGKTFLTGALDLKSDMTLQVEGTLQGSNTPADYLARPEYPGMVSDEGLILTRYEGWELYCYRSLLNAGYLNPENRKEVTCENLTIRGSGTIRSGGNTLGVNMRNSMYNNASRYPEYVSDGTPGRRVRGRLLGFIQCKNLNLSGVLGAKLNIQNPPCWTIHMIYCDTVNIHGLDIRSSGVDNGDGIDPDSTRNLMVFDCLFTTGDDCIAVKSGKNPDGNIVNMPTENLRIFDLEMGGGHGMAVGSEQSGGVRGLYIRDLNVHNTNYGLELKANNDRGGFIEDVLILDSVFNQLLVHSVSYNADGGAAPDMPVFRNITIKNTAITDSNPELFGFYRAGHDDAALGHPVSEHYLRNVLFENVTFGKEGDATRRISLRYADGITFRNSTMWNGVMPALEIGADVTNLVVDNKTPEFTAAIEAEEMESADYTSYRTVRNTIASGSHYRNIALNNTGTLFAKYTGESGLALLQIDYFDITGAARYELYIGDRLVDSWTADQDLGSSVSGATLVSQQVGALIEHGDVVRLVGTKVGSDSAAVDTLSLSVTPGAKTLIQNVVTGQDDAVEAVTVFVPQALAAPADLVVEVYSIDNTAAPAETIVKAGAVQAAGEVMVLFTPAVAVAQNQFYIIYVRDSEGHPCSDLHYMTKYTSTRLAVILDGTILEAPSKTNPMRLVFNTTPADLDGKLLSADGAKLTFVFYPSRADAEAGVNRLTDRDTLWSGYILAVTALDGVTTEYIEIEVRDALSIIKLASGQDDYIGSQFGGNITSGGGYVPTTATMNVQNNEGIHYFQAQSMPVGGYIQFETPIEISAGKYTGELFYKGGNGRGAFDVLLIDAADAGKVFVLGAADLRRVTAILATIDIAADGPVDIPNGSYKLRYVCTAAGNLTSALLTLRAWGESAQPGAPVIRMPALADFTMLSTDSEKTVAVIATATGGLPVTLTAESDAAGVAAVAVAGKMLTVTPVGTGTAHITVTANAAGCMPVSRTFSVAVAAPPPTNVYLSVGGRIVIDAVDAMQNTAWASHSNENTVNTALGEAKWEAVEDGRSIQFKHVLGTHKWQDTDIDNPNAKVPCLTFKVYVTEPGTYYLSFFANSPDFDSDSFHIGVDGQRKFATNSISQAAGAAWFHVGSSYNVTLTEGEHTITIWPREPFLLLRQIVLRTATSASYSGWLTSTFSGE